MNDPDAERLPLRGGIGWTRRATARDVAAVAGVSPQTVSRVVNGGDGVRPETRAQVLEAMAIVGYAPNAAARTLRSGRSDILGVVTHHLSRTGEASVVGAIAEAAHAHDYGVSLIAVERSGTVADFNDAIASLHQRSAGLVIIGLETIPVEELRLPRRLPLIVNDSRRLSLPSIGFDQSGGGVVATEHLLGLGHQTVHHVRGPSGSMQAQLREAGWRSALEAAGRKVPEVWIGDWTPASGYRAGLEIAADPTVSAVFVANDEMAAGLCRAIHEAGLRIPQDISVVGFDDLIAEYVFPPLTSVHQDFSLLGEELVNALVSYINAPGGSDSAAPSLSMIIESPLVVRTSSGPPGRR